MKCRQINRRLDKVEKILKEQKKSLKTDIQEIALVYGYEPQSRQLIEEMAELTQAINKFWRLSQKSAPHEKMVEARKHIIEEVADVGIMLEQITYLLNAHEDVAEITEEKVKRQIARIEKESEK